MPHSFTMTQHRNGPRFWSGIKINVKNYFKFYIPQRRIKFTVLRSITMKKIIPIEEGDFYLSEQGYKVFTEKYHLRRGYCCESGCRHCPYGYNSKTNKYT